MNLQNTESVAKRRVHIVLTITPFTVAAAFQGAYAFTRALWAGAAEQWKHR
jgi:hypothetical protein